MKNIITFTVTLMISFLLAEFGFRVYSDYVSIYDLEMHKYAKKIKRASSKNGLTHEHIPDSEAKLMGVNININSHGFRDTELEFKKKQNENRILVVGSSITMGWGVPFDSVFTQIVERKLNSNQDSIYFNIYNSGIGNYNTEKEFTLFKENFPEIAPNEVILHYYLNDAEILPEGNANFLVKHSYVFALLYVRFKQLMAINHSDFTTIGSYYLNLYDGDSQGWENTKLAILGFENLCKKNNVKFTVLVQPDLHNLTDESDQFKCHQILRSFFANSNIAYIDLFSEYQKKFESNPNSIWVSPDDSHPNSQGHKIIANSLFANYKF